MYVLHVGAHCSSVCEWVVVAVDVTCVKKHLCEPEHWTWTCKWIMNVAAATHTHRQRPKPYIGKYIYRIYFPPKNHKRIQMRDWMLWTHRTTGFISSTVDGVDRGTGSRPMYSRIRMWMRFRVLFFVCGNDEMRLWFLMQCADRNGCGLVAVCDLRPKSWRWLMTIMTTAMTLKYITSIFYALYTYTT